jgi:hypothetical protein
LHFRLFLKSFFKGIRGYDMSLFIEQDFGANENGKGVAKPYTLMKISGCLGSLLKTLKYRSNLPLSLFVSRAMTISPCPPGWMCGSNRTTFILQVYFILVMERRASPVLKTWNTL